VTKVVGKYEILEPLGATGSVFRARDTVLEREVALKTIVAGTDVSPEVKERFYREARACARLQHPHIVTIYDLGEQDGTAYIVMELLAGADLARILAEKRPMALEAKLDLAIQVAEALDYAHRQEIVHRDIKPANIFVQQDRRAKILDFGVARVAASKLTRMGAALGTPDYMAPEQLAGQVCDGRSDLFSAAIVFFELFSGVHPFAGRSLPRRIVTQAPAMLRSVAPDLPDALEDVMARGLAKEVALRFQTGEEFAKALRAVAAEVAGVGPRIAAPPAEPPPAEPRPIPPADPILGALRLRAQQLLEKDPVECGSFIASLGPKQQADPEIARVRGLAEAQRPAAPVVATAVLEAPASPEIPAGNFAAETAAEDAAGRAPTEPPPVKVEIAPALPPAPEAARPSPALQPLPQPLPPGAASRRHWQQLTVLSPSQKRIIAGCGIGAFLAALVIAFQISRSARPPMPVGTARVQSEAGRLVRAPREDARLVTSLKNGEAVHLLALPASLDDGWVQVQAARGRAGPSGYCRVSELTDWSSEKPDTALQLLKLFAPRDSATDAAMETHLQRLKAFSARFGVTPQGPPANLERARFHLALAKRFQQALRPPEDWQSHLDDATGQLAMASAEPELEPEVQRARQDLEALKAWEPPRPPRIARTRRGPYR
jgi:hypothetical protein